MYSPENHLPAASRPSEDQDLLERSTKKTKVTLQGQEGESMDDVEMEPAKQLMVTEKQETYMGVAEVRPIEMGVAASYRAILTGTENGKEREEAELEEVSDDEEDGPRRDEPDCPVIRLSRMEKARLRKPWRQSLIIKVMGRKVGYAYLLRRLNIIWHPKSKMELITLENDYYLVKFASALDYEFVKFGGPWMIMDHYLIVKEWTPNFDPMTDTTEKMLVWVRFPNLPMEYYDQSFLFRVGEKIGRPIMIDGATTLTSRGKFARLCVEVDITKPLLARFWLRDKIRRIEYEGIHLICFRCGIYGHNHGSCPQTQVENNSAEVVSESSQGMGINQGVNANGQNMKAKEGTRTQPESLEPYGPWMIVKRPPRRQVSTHGKKQGVKNGMSGYHNDNNFGDKNNQSKASGSRFAVLEDEILNGENFNVNMMEDQTENSECSPVRGSCLNEKAKGKRPTVQVSAKQILGLNGSQPLRPMVEQNNEQQRRSAGYSRRETGGHKAAAAEEHIVVRGENHGAHIVTTTVRHIDNTTLTRNNAEDMMEEHHSDPPRMGNSVEAEVVMEEALPQGQGDDICIMSPMDL